MSAAVSLLPSWPPPPAAVVPRPKSFPKRCACCERVLSAHDWTTLPIIGLQQTMLEPRVSLNGVDLSPDEAMAFRIVLEAAAELAPLDRHLAAMVDMVEAASQGYGELRNCSCGSTLMVEVNP